MNPAPPVTRMRMCLRLMLQGNTHTSGESSEVSADHAGRPRLVAPVALSLCLFSLTFPR